MGSDWPRGSARLGFELGDPGARVLHHSDTLPRRFLAVVNFNDSSLGLLSPSPATDIWNFTKTSLEDFVGPW